MNYPKPTTAWRRMRAAQIESELSRERRFVDRAEHRAHLDRLRREWLRFQDTIEQKHLRTLHSLRCWKSAPRPLADAREEMELELVTLGLSGICCAIGSTGRRKAAKRDWKLKREDRT